MHPAWTEIGVQVIGAEAHAERMQRKQQPYL